MTVLSHWQDNISILLNYATVYNIIVLVEHYLILNMYHLTLCEVICISLISSTTLSEVM